MSEYEHYDIPTCAPCDEPVLNVDLGVPWAHASDPVNELPEPWQPVTLPAHEIEPYDPSHMSPDDLDDMPD